MRGKSVPLPVYRNLLLFGEDRKTRRAQTEGQSLRVVSASDGRISPTRSASQRAIWKRPFCREGPAFRQDLCAGEILEARLTESDQPAVRIDCAGCGSSGGDGASKAIEGRSNPLYATCRRRRASETVRLSVRRQAIARR